MDAYDSYNDAWATVRDLDSEQYSVLAETESEIPTHVNPVTAQPVREKPVTAQPVKANPPPMNHNDLESEKKAYENIESYIKEIANYFPGESVSSDALKRAPARVARQGERQLVDSMQHYMDGGSKQPADVIARIAADGAASMSDYGLPAVQQYLLATRDALNLH